eukprot:scaffold26859_cov134-Isochrysis_galbana.AAC.3
MRVDPGDGQLKTVGRLRMIHLHRQQLLLKPLVLVPAHAGFDVDGVDVHELQVRQMQSCAARGAHHQLLLPELSSGHLRLQESFDRLSPRLTEPRTDPVGRLVRHVVAEPVNPAVGSQLYHGGRRHRLFKGWRLPVLRNVPARAEPVVECTVRLAGHRLLHPNQRRLPGIRHHAGSRGHRLELVDDRPRCLYTIRGSGHIPENARVAARGGAARYGHGCRRDGMQHQRPKKMPHAGGRQGRRCPKIGLSAPS